MKKCGLDSTTQKLPSLLAAVKEGSSFHILEEIIDLGADLEERDRGGETVLMIAVQKTDMVLFQKLISAGADTSAKDNNNSSVILHAVARASSLNYENGIDLLTASVDKKAEALASQQKSHFEMVKILLNSGASISVMNNGRESLLMAATKQGFTKLMKFLLSAGADANVKDCKGQTALFKVLNEKSVEVLLQGGANPNGSDTSILMHFLDRPTPLFGCAKLVIEAGVDPSAPDCYGVTPLMYWCGNLLVDHHEVVHFLVEAGADPLYQDNTGNCALSCAIMFGRIKSIKYLLAAGGNPSSRNNRDSSLLEIVSHSQFLPINSKIQAEIVHLLIEAGADVDVETYGGKYNATGIMPTVNFSTSLHRHDFQLHIPDALYTAFRYGHSTVLPLLLPFWSAPPLSLYIFQHSAYINTLFLGSHLFSTLLERGGPLPPGHTHIATIQNFLDSFPENCVDAKVLSENFKKAHCEAPPSLKQLCRHVIRGCAESGYDLPERLSSLVPHGIRPFLTLMG